MFGLLLIEPKNHVSQKTLDLISMAAKQMTVFVAKSGMQLSVKACCRCYFNHEGGAPGLCHRASSVRPTPWGPIWPLGIHYYNVGVMQ
jgi:hypothetical protein